MFFTFFIANDEIVKQISREVNTGISDMNNHETKPSNIADKNVFVVFQCDTKNKRFYALSQMTPCQITVIAVTNCLPVPGHATRGTVPTPR